MHGDVLSKDLKEASDKELAGVAAVWLPEPLAEMTKISLEGNLLRLDSSVRSLQVWKPDESADKAFAGLPIDAAQRAMLRERFEAYRQYGLKGVPTGDLLARAIQRTESLERVPGYVRALLEFPADPLPDVEHRFVAYEQEVEGRPTLILSHRAAVRGESDALITEQRYFVSGVYDGRFIASDCHEVSGGTLLFYVNVVFTDRVAGIGSSLRHAIGRRRMLAGVVANLKRIREQLLRLG